jgi:transposase
MSDAARRRVRTGYAMIEATNAEALPLRAELARFGTRQPACRALVGEHFGVGGLTAVAIWSELGDCRRFSRSMQVVRHAGIDVTVDSSDAHRASGHLSHQGPGILRWALYEAAKASARPAAPDYAYYRSVKQRHDGKLAALAVARKLARRCYHTLRGVDPEEVYATV